MDMSGMAQLVRLAVEVLETRKSVVVPSQVITQVSDEYRTRLTPEIKAIRCHHKKATDEWGDRKLY